MIVPLLLDSHIDVAANIQPVTVGVPFPKGQIREPFSAAVEEVGEVQTETLARWSDGSVRWLLVDFLAPALAAGSNRLALRISAPHASAESVTATILQVEEHPDRWLVDTGPARFHVDRETLFPFKAVECGDRPLLDDARTSTIALVDPSGVEHIGRIASSNVETQGPLRLTLLLDGSIPYGRGLRFQARLCFFAGTGLVRLRYTLHNSARAQHRGGTWDLRDAGSTYFQDLSLRLKLACDETTAYVRTEPQREPAMVAGGRFTVYQDSSGGQNWQSRVHVNHEGRVPCRIRGYEMSSAAGQQTGLRAEPVVRLAGERGSLTISVPEFWQQFPKAIRNRGDELEIGLFPGEWDDLFELQGGERKTHTLWLDFKPSGESTPDSLDWTHQPVRALATPDWYCRCRAMPHLSPASSAPEDRLKVYLREALTGENSLFAKREAIDQYGWRHFGDAWGDHEQRYFQGQGLVVSHYNNQFDMVAGAIRQAMRSGESRWFDVFDPLARHVMDIDIYHTALDKAAYNGGLFWFTDHYLDASTATHRTFSQHNAPPDGRPYGGGPGAEHNFAAGLLLYYYLTGNPDARAAVLGLADWVINMDDAAGSVLGILDDGPTGLASMSGSLDYHGPGRGAANSIEVLLTAFELTGTSAYMAKAETLIRRSIHPTDAVEQRELLDVESRWSYTMFLAALVRYLDIKAERDETDRMFCYAQASLIAYATWMLEHERPYFDHPEQLEFPTEAWAAQELRKANVMRLAARHVDGELASKLDARGEQLAERAWGDLLSFDSRLTTRAIAIMMTEGACDAFLSSTERVPAARPVESYTFASPEPFTAQKTRVLARLKSPWGLCRLAARFLQPVAWRRTFALLKRRTIS